MSSEMEEGMLSNVPDAEIVGIQFGLASNHEIRASSISDCPISHASQLANPFLGLPLEAGKCESCGTAEPGKCEGHFGYIELPIPVYHPAHISELRRMLSLICLKCLKMKTNKLPVKSNGVMERLLSACCEEACHISIKENKNSDGASYLQLRIPGRSRIHDDSWNFLEKFGYRYGDGSTRTLLASEVSVMLKKLSGDTRKKLAKKGYFPQDGYIVRYLPVPPNCLSVPDVSDGVSVMSSDLCGAMLKKVLRQIEIIRSSRSGEPNFESHEVEANDLQIAVSMYLDVRGTGKAARDRDNRYGVNKEGTSSSTKAWLEKMRTLFISKGSGYSSRSVITGDAYRAVDEVGIPSEIAQKMTFEERVNVHNIQFLQNLVDKNLCLTFRDGSATYSLREGSKGHTFLRIGQVVHRRIMDGDIVFINRPPTTHKHSLQALRVYIHDDHVVKINPLMCGPLAADFDGDCVHLFYPQSLSARAEVLELFSVDKQLLSSHSGNLNLQLASDALLSLKTIFRVYFRDKPSAQQLAMHASSSLPSPAVVKGCSSGPCWTAQQVLKTALPPEFECHGERLLIRGGEVVKLDFNRDVIASIINDILTSLFFSKSPKEALNFFDSLQPLLMENLFAEGFSVSLQDFYVPFSELENIQTQIQDTIAPLLFQLRSSFNDLIQLQYESSVRQIKVPVANFILRCSALGNLIDSRSESAIEKIVQQIGFLGLQLSDKRKFYSRNLVEEVASLFKTKNPFASLYPSEEFGLVKSCFFRGLDPYEGMVHSIATREVIVRSSKGLAEPGTLFKNLMAVLRDVVICYDGSVRNVSSNSVIQFDYGLEGVPSQSLFPAGEPVGVLAATAMSNPAYKAVLDSSPNSNSSWDLMKEILFCRVNFKNDMNDRRVILYLNDCGCGKKYCQENASFIVKNHLKKISLRDAAIEFSIEYKRPKAEQGSLDVEAGLVGHIHLNASLLKESNISLETILRNCEEQVSRLRKKKKYGFIFRRIELSTSECGFLPCLRFFWQDLSDQNLEKISNIMIDMISPYLLDTVIKGDPRISSVNIVWISPGTTSWVQSPCSGGKGELAVEVTLEKTSVRQCGDAWRIVLDCCLPVFHLIDSRRSIPYAIKQIQDLFGISCAFDQVVQRLSTSVTMVTKGVLKEHLILLASSMTCSGNLVGFNISGIKALCRALSAQVPFTEATLYTPRKCFERASEKCHVDALAGIVASCSWGKRVAVGTGAKFDVLWDTKEIGASEKPIDVYNFLHLVRSSVEEEIDSGGLGDDVDKFGLEDAFMEPAMSPEQEIKAVFEDSIDLGVDSQEQGGGVSSWDALPSSGKGWDTGSGSAEGNGWADWGSKKDQAQVKDSSEPGGWNAAKNNSGTEANGWADWGSKKQPEDSSKPGSWGVAKNASATEGNGWADRDSKKDQAVPEELSKPGGWGVAKSNSEADRNGWANSGPKKDKLQPEGSSNPGGWGAAKTNLEMESKSQPSWGNSSPVQSQKPSGPSWSNNNNESGCSAQVNKQGGSGSWGSQKEESQPQSSWGQQKNSNESAEKWNSDKGQKESGSGSWDSKKDGSKTPAWGQLGSSGGKISTQNSDEWGSKKSNQPVISSGWGSGKPATGSLEKDNEGGSSGWNSGKGTNTPSSWGQHKDSNGRGSFQSGSKWSNQALKGNEVSGSQSWKSNQVENKSQSTWGKPSSNEWGSEKSNQPGNSSGWGPGNGGLNGSDKIYKEERSGAWGSKSVDKTAHPSGWGSGNAVSGSLGKVHEADISGDWDSKSGDKKSKSSWGQAKQTGNSSGWGSGKADLDGSGTALEVASSGEWNSKSGDKKSPSSWGQPKQPGNSSGWGSGKADFDGSGTAQEAASSGDWNSKSADKKSQSSWGQPKQPGASGWGSGKADLDDSGKANEANSSGDWDSKSGDKKSQSSWGQLSQPGNSSGWGSQNADPSGSDMTKEDSPRSWDSKSGPRNTQSSWGNPTESTWKSSPVADGWGSNKSNNSGNSSGWGSGKADAVLDGDKKRPDGGRGWGSSNSGEWKSRKNRPLKQPGVNDDSNNVLFTATRKRMDLFPEEEKDVLSEVESIMQSIRRIMHQSGCNDGDPLLSEDQSYIINNVLNYHPDKAAKMGAGVDYITVKKHTNFQESRCFFIVKTDGQSEDFSYIKCMENFVKGKHPLVAESFNSKYFRKPRPVGNRQQGQFSQSEQGQFSQSEQGQVPQSEQGQVSQSDS